ncbi:MAG: L,D-transpeptidase [Thermoanaerobaculia bacterium]
MPERRKEKRPASSDRRSFPRPPLWLNLTVLILALTLVSVAKIHRIRLNQQFQHFVAADQSSPEELRQLRNQLASMDLSREEMKQELDSRLGMIEGLRSDEFYLSIDHARGKLYLYYGDKIIREADVRVGSSATIRTRDGAKQWTFVPLRGAFRVTGKRVGLDWKIPEWVYVREGRPVPAERPSIEGGLGNYVIFLPNHYVIHSPPADSSPLRGPKPGSFMVPEEDLRAIWPRIEKGMQVYIF